LKNEGKEKRDAEKKRLRIKINHKKSPFKLASNFKNNDKKPGAIKLENMTIKEIEDYVKSL